eukprot:COSAG01_NODE_54798_length_329_cov_1.600000_1_plen_23_part_10
MIVDRTGLEEVGVAAQAEELDGV